jgi:hypothetical protein
VRATCWIAHELNYPLLAAFSGKIDMFDWMPGYGGMETHLSFRKTTVCGSVDAAYWLRRWDVAHRLPVTEY